MLNYKDVIQQNLEFTKSLLLCCTCYGSKISFHFLLSEDTKSFEKWYIKGGKIEQRKIRRSWYCSLYYRNVSESQNLQLIIKRDFKSRTDYNCQYLLHPLDWLDMWECIFLSVSVHCFSLFKFQVVIMLHWFIMVSVTMKLI